MNTETKKLHTIIAACEEIALDHHAKEIRISSSRDPEVNVKIITMEFTFGGIYAIAESDAAAQYLQSAWTQPCLPHYASQCDSRLGDGDSGDIIVSFSFWLTAEEYQEAA